MSIEENHSNNNTLENLRYFKVKEDFYFDGIPLEIGDIVIIPNECIINTYALNSEFTFKCFSNQNLNEILGEYPKDQLITSEKLVDFLKKKKIQTFDCTDVLSLQFGFEEGVYLNKELAERVFADSNHTEEFDISAASYGPGFWYPNMPLDKANKRFKANYEQNDGYSFPMPLGDINRRDVIYAGGIHLVSKDLTNDSSESTINNTELSFIEDKIVPGIYNTEKPVSVVFHMYLNEIDFGKHPEFLYNFVNHSFLHFLNNTTEITNIKEKRSIYTNINQDTITPNKDEKIRYYRLKPGVSINADYFHVDPNDTLKKEYLSVTGNDDFNTDRVEGTLQIVKRNSNNEPEIIKIIINEGSKANYAYITDKELSKIADRLYGFELSMTRINDIIMHKKEQLLELRNMYNSKTLERQIKLIDVAASRVKKWNYQMSLSKMPINFSKKILLIKMDIINNQNH